jgi:hypothetical protein
MPLGFGAEDAAERPGILRDTEFKANFGRPIQSTGVQSARELFDGQ